MVQPLLRTEEFLVVSYSLLLSKINELAAEQSATMI